MKTHAGFEVIEDAGDYQTLRCPKCDHTFRADAYGLNVLYDLKHTLIPQCESCGFTEAVLIKDEEAEANYQRLGRSNPREESPRDYFLHRDVPALEWLARRTRNETRSTVMDEVLTIFFRSTCSPNARTRVTLETMEAPESADPELHLLMLKILTETTPDVRYGERVKVQAARFMKNQHADIRDAANDVGLRWGSTWNT